MTIESDDLAALRETTSKALLGLLWLHVPIALAIGVMRDNGWLAPTALMAAMAIAATVSWASSGNGLSTRLIFAVALMGGVSVFAYQLAGHPWQIDMHMYFFAALACLVAYCDYRPILAGTVAVALHHLALNFLLPAAIYPGGADLGRVVLHAVILLMEAGVLCSLSFKLSHLFEATAQKTAEAEAAGAAEARANRERMEIESKSKQDRDTARRELAAGFERKVASIVEAVAVAATKMQGLSSTMSGSNAETTRKTAAAAAASNQASTNVETVASATEELAASINSIAQQVTRSAEIAAKAAEEARRTNTVVEGLAAGTQKIGEVVTLIQNIASQTNLLALNATIEAESSSVAEATVSTLLEAWFEAAAAAAVWRVVSALLPLMVDDRPCIFVAATATASTMLPTLRSNPAASSRRAASRSCLALPSTSMRSRLARASEAFAASASAVFWAVASNRCDNLKESAHSTPASISRMTA